jgi:hypothetical protein
VLSKEEGRIFLKGWKSFVRDVGYGDHGQVWMEHFEASEVECRAVL